MITVDKKILTDEIIKKVEFDLRCYPDWIVRIDCGGLGLQSRGFAEAKGMQSFRSGVELEVDIEEEIKIKVEIIEKVFDRFHGSMKDIIEYRYFQDYGRNEIIKMAKIKNKEKYYYLRDRAIECFARALGYIT